MSAPEEKQRKVEVHFCIGWEALFSSGARAVFEDLLEVQLALTCFAPARPIAQLSCIQHVVREREREKTLFIGKAERFAGV